MYNTNYINVRPNETYFIFILQQRRCFNKRVFPSVNNGQLFHLQIGSLKQSRKGRVRVQIVLE